MEETRTRWIKLRNYDEHGDSKELSGKRRKVATEDIIIDFNDLQRHSLEKIRKSLEMSRNYVITKML